MNELGIPAARSVARRVESYFAERIGVARQEGEPRLAPLAATVETLVNVAFWASLRREEGREPTISLAFVPAFQADRAILFERALPLTSEILTRLAPAVEAPGIHLGIWTGPNGLSIWGATRIVPPLCFVLEVVAPGLLVVKHPRREGDGKFVNVVVIEGDRIKVIGAEPNLPDCPAMVTALRGLESPASWTEPINVLVQLALSMRAHRRGGTLLLVPHGSDAWLESVVRPLAYAVAPPFAGLAERAREAGPDASEKAARALQRAIDDVAGLTAVDGATVLADDYHLLAFGAKIVRRRGSPPVERVVRTEPLEGVVPQEAHPSDLGGTRHLSAAQFVQDQRDALALVASQDGRFTVFAWSPCQEMVHAHRVESLLV